MNTDSIVSGIGSPTGIVAGTVVAVSDDGTIIIRSEEKDLICKVMRPPGGSGPSDLRAGQEVLVWEGSKGGNGVVLGIIGANDAPCSQEIPEHIVLEARVGLTLKVGDGSITIREDGRILIKGRDLVSHAKRNNRIRGGSVQIN